MPDSTLPLSGIRVVEFCQVLAGPFCGCLLADMGADVIKVEPPDGDLMRQWPPLIDGYSQYFASVNRNKRSVALDLKVAGNLAAARKLALSADVVLENFRPGVMRKFGLDYANLAVAKPALVYCSVSAFGQSGPRAGEGGFDMTVQAISGAMSVTGEPDGRPAKCGIPIADFTTGLYAAYSVAAALRNVACGVPCAPINRYSQVVADAQVEHMQWVEDITLPNGHATRTVVSPQRISGRRLGVYRRPPALGEHTAEILAELE